MRRYVLSEDTIIEESQRVTTIHPLFDAVGNIGNLQSNLGPKNAPPSRPALSFGLISHQEIQPFHCAKGCLNSPWEKSRIA